MTNVLGWVLTATVLAWLTAETVMQVRQYRMGGRARVTEWRSLGVIVVAIIGGVVVGGLAATALPGLRLPVGTGVLLAIAVPLVWLGVGLRLWAIHTLGRFFRGVVQVQEDHEVVRTGPYRVIRHPAYAGVFVAIIGLALTLHNAAAIVVYLVCAGFAIGYRIRVEERTLRTELGRRYADYAETTARLVPHVW